jgi:hypothetical protein
VNKRGKGGKGGEENSSKAGRGWSKKKEEEDDDGGGSLAGEGRSGEVGGRASEYGRKDGRRISLTM